MKLDFKKTIFAILIFSLMGFFSLAFELQKKLIEIYKENESLIILDRNGKEIAILPNKKGNFARYSNEVPENFKNILLKKEDRYFYYHLGLNPVSILKAALGRIGILERKASSTITQQLVKILLEKEKERNFKNKIIETAYAISLEIYQPKEEILKMYFNSVYLGNQIQGFEEAAKSYFKTSSYFLTHEQIIQLLATVSNPSGQNPLKEKNVEVSSILAKKLNLTENLNFESPRTIKENFISQEKIKKSFFEISFFINKNSKNKKIALTVDENLSQKIREIVKNNIEELKQKNAKNAAVVVIKLPENEILTIIGSPDPDSFEQGYKINMAKEYRAIGSTIKPFIYLKAFEKGLRPYTIVEDKEYKYITALGFPLYPKNFDWQYHGKVNLHYALSNSLNVPTVKVLEYLGLENFYNFLERDLNFAPIQNWNNYQLGIALGSLEMSLIDLAKCFTIFPNNGILKDLKIYKDQNQNEKKIIDPEYIQLINRILNDRITGIEQFGLKSDLNLFQKNYALKTGTSRDFRDSWIIGYTPDFLVGVWVGNADNSKTEEISGQLGAGKIWADTMELIFSTEYNKKRVFNFDLIKEFQDENNIEYGLKHDDYEKLKNLLLQNENSLILEPHNNDIFLLEENAKIFLKAKKEVLWFANKKFLGQGREIIFNPNKSGQYQITAKDLNNLEENINIFIF